MGEYCSCVSFTDACKYECDILEAALNRRVREYDEEEEKWVSYPCTKEESVRIALEVFDGLVHHAKEFLYASKALERIMKAHGLEVGRDYSLQEYMDARMQVECESEKNPGSFISVVK